MRAFTCGSCLGQNYEMVIEFLVVKPLADRDNKPVFESEQTQMSMEYRTM
jgi:DNA-directed RNA polymerase subunit N (RpoN/RPB10)